MKGTRNLRSFTIFLLAMTAVLPVLVSLHPAYAPPAPKVKFTLEGLTLAPNIKMTSGDMKGWIEDDWLPFQLTIDASDATSLPTLSIDLDYSPDASPTSSSNFGIDAFANCFSSTGPNCGSGPTPVKSGDAVGTGTLWKVQVTTPTPATSEMSPTVSFFTFANSLHIRFQFTDFALLKGTTVMTWAVHLALSGGNNLVCSTGELTCSWGNTIGAGHGAFSYHGSSLHVANPEGNQDVPIKNEAGHIIIEKQTIPSGSSQSFGFSWSGGPTTLSPPTFSLMDGQSQNSGPIMPGSGYSATEDVPGGWTLASISCSSDGTESQTSVDLDNHKVNIDLGLGETVTCVFTNSQSPPPGESRIIVTKLTVGGDGAFDYTASGGGGLPSSFTIATTAGIGSVFYDVSAPAVYTVTEDTLPAGWEFTSLDCGGTGNVVMEQANRKATITFSDTGQIESCTYRDTLTSPELEPAIGGSLAPVNAFAVLAPYLAMLGFVGAVGAAFVLRGRKA